MKILDRYILKKLLSTFIFVVLILVFVIIVIDFTEKNDKFIRNDLNARQILFYYLNFIPYIASLLTPITAFIAVVFVTANMAVRTEIVAILASGTSFVRMMVPYAIFATIIGAMSFGLNGWIIPTANKGRVAFEIAYIKGAYYFSERNIHFKVGPQDYVYMDRYSNQNDIGYRVTLETFEGTELKEKMFATQMAWDSTSRKWKLKAWNRRKLVDNGEVFERGFEKDTTIAIWPSDFENSYHLHETFTMPELNDYIELQQSRGADDTLIYIVEKLVRYTQPFTVVILTFIGVIVSARKARGGAGFQIALGFLIAFVFIIFFIMARASAEAGSMPPLLAIWIPNIIFSFIGLLMYHTVPR